MPKFYSYNNSFLLLLLLLVLPLVVTAQTREDRMLLQKQATEKLAPTLQQSLQKNTSGSYIITVKDKAAFKVWLQEQKIIAPAKEVAAIRNAFSLTGISGSQLKELVGCPYVTFIDRANRTPQEEAELRDVDFAANNIPVVQTRYPELNGDGMVVSIKEGAFNPNDIDLKARILAPETFGPAYTPHATTMATIIAGAGNSGPRGKGIATKAILATSDFALLLPDNSSTLLSNGIGIQNHSYGVGVENYYGLESAAYDQQTFQNPQILHVFSSGNSGNKANETGTYANLPAFANLTGQFKNSKNTLSVGALEPDNKIGLLSSRGPAYDGRIKPELVAYGIGGTSEAAAVVSGVAVLVQQAYKQQHGALPSAALVKATLINSADDVGRPQVDFESGFGNTDALGAVRSMLESRFIETTVAQDEQKSFTIHVPEGAKQLKVTIVWHDREAEPNAAKALLNDLNLQVRKSGTSNSWLPWVLSTFPHPDSLAKPAKRGTDHLNNVEQVTVEMPAAGDYELLVNGYKIQDKAQEFSLVYEYEHELEWLYPSLGLSLKAGELNRIRWQGSTSNEPLQLAYRLSGDRDWTSVKELNASTLYYDWQAPDTVSSAQLRLTAGNTSIESDHFILSRPLKLQVGFDCVDNTMVYWPSLSGVKEYQLLHVDKAYLTTLFTTTDTLAILNKQALQNLGEYVLIAPVIDGMPGETSTAVAFARQGAGCYIKSFLPEHFVMDTVLLDLEISTLYQVNSITLERKQHGTFKPVTSMSPIKTQKFKLNDPAPVPGSNFYRVKVETTAGLAFYSDEEEAVYASPGFIQAYPNPVQAGQPLYIAIGNDSAQIQLFDRLGRLLIESEDTGVVKTLDTTGLQKGLHILRLKTENGTYISTKVIIL